MFAEGKFMEKLIELRTSRTNKLYGVLDVGTYALHIKESKFTRIIPISKEGATVKISSGKQLEEIYIPPQEAVLK